MQDSPHMTSPSHFSLLMLECQPPTKDELLRIEQATKQGPVVVVLSGRTSPTRADSPWTTAEREDFLHLCFPRAAAHRLTIVSTRRRFYRHHDALIELSQAISHLLSATTHMTIVGEDPIGLRAAVAFFTERGITSTAEHFSGECSKEFRQNYLLSADEQAWQESCLPALLAPLKAFKHTDRFQHLAREAQNIQHYKNSWKTAPYPPIFVTVDAIILQADHILVIRRRDYPGKGTLALPGGFLDAEEVIVDAALRELHEETTLSLPRDSLMKHIVAQEVFDHPRRSLRGRTITHAFLLELGNDPNLPKVHGTDDAQEALWIPCNKLAEYEAQFFDDHFEIVECLFEKRGKK